MDPLMMPEEQDEAGESSALEAALGQIRDLLDQIEASQVQDKMKPAAPPPPEVKP